MEDKNDIEDIKNRLRKDIKDYRDPFNDVPGGISRSALDFMYDVELVLNDHDNIMKGK